MGFPVVRSCRLVATVAEQGICHNNHGDKHHALTTRGKNTSYLSLLPECITYNLTCCHWNDIISKE